MLVRKNDKGVVIPPITPLRADLSLDKDALETIMVVCHKNNLQPFILGTTGESSSFSNTFKVDFIKAACKIKTPGMPLYAGISSNCFDESIELAKAAFDNGV